MAITINGEYRYTKPLSNDGTTEDSQQMNNPLKPNIFRRSDGSYFYQANPNAEEIDLTPLNTRLSNDPSQWTYTDAAGKIYTPAQPLVNNTGEITQGRKNTWYGYFTRPITKYFDELKYRANTNPSSIALQGKYVIPAIAASALLPLAGEAFAGSTIAGVPATTWANTALTAGFAGHGLNHAINEGINGYGDAFMTALELTPLGRVARPMWNTGKEVAYNIADRYMFMPHQGTYTRGIGMTDAGLQDAVTTGVFRGNPRGTEQTAKVFDKMFLKNRNHFRDIVKDTGIPGIESRYQSRTLTKEDFDALKKASEKYESLESGNTVGKITLRQSIDPLENYATYEDYIKAVASDIAKTEQMPSRIASGEIVPNTELSEPMWFEDESGRMLLPQGKPFLERFGPNSDYLADGTPLSYWYADGRNPVTQGHAYAKSNYGVRVNIPEDYQPFMHELHLHPSFFRSPKFSDPNVEIFGKGPLGLTVKLDKETLQPLWKKDLSNIFKGNKVTTPQITAENAAITPTEGNVMKVNGVPIEPKTIVKTVLDNGKIRLSLPSHTDAKPRLIVLEPAGDNKYYVHMRMWDDIEKKIPASNVTNEEKQQLFDALYDELPEGAEILFPKSGPGNYGTRGTVAGLQRLSRNPRFTPGTKGTLQYLDKDGKTVRTYEGTSFIKTENGWQGNRYVLDLTTLEGILNFIDNDIIPRILAQGHNVSSYTPTFRQFSPKTDAFDEAVSKANSGSGAWFTPASNDVTIRGPLEKQDFGLAIHEAGGHGLRYNMLPDYVPTKREYLNEYIITGGKDMSDEAANALLKMHTGDQVFNTIEALKLRESYPWIKTYFERNPTKKSGDTVLRESGSVNTQFRSHYSNNGKIVGKELDKAIDKASPGVVLRDLIEQPYTSSIIEDIAKITGKDPDALLFYGPEMLEKLVNQYPKLLEIVSKVKDTMKTVGSYGVPITVGSSTAATLYEKLK